MSPKMAIMDFLFLYGQTLPSQPSTPSHDDQRNARFPVHTDTDSPSLSTGSAFAAMANDSVGETNPLHPQGCIEHYDILRKIGQGGMGSVFLARDRRLERLVAIKVLHGERQSLARLMAEARATARARHENIVVLFDIGTFEGRPYMVFEYLSGETLRHVLSGPNGEAGGRLQQGSALEVMISVVRALSAAHKVGIIHRDLKPENIMLVDTGQVKLLDFGLARRTDAVDRSKPAGTFAYMAPEQWLGEDVDERCDIWAVGLVLFEVFAGTHPLAAKAMGGVSSITDVDTPMPTLGAICPGLGSLSGVVDRCLRKRKEERFVSADELLRALESSRMRSVAATRGRPCSDCPLVGEQNITLSVVPNTTTHPGVRHS